MRTDSHNNPTAFTTDVAAEAGLKLGIEYTVGDPFSVGSMTLTLHTARLIGDPIELTIRVIDRIGFYTKLGVQRWSYIGIPRTLWLSQTPAIKSCIIGGMYLREGGKEMLGKFSEIFHVL